MNINDNNRDVLRDKSPEQSRLFLEALLLLCKVLRKTKQLLDHQLTNKPQNQLSEDLCLMKMNQPLPGSLLFQLQNS